MTAIVEYSQTEAALAALKEKHKDVVFDMKTTAGDKAAREARAELVSLRTTLEKKRVELKAPILQQGRDLDEEAKRIELEIIALEKPIDAQIKADEQRREEERQQRIRNEEIKARMEIERIERHRKAINEIASYTLKMVGKSVAEIEALIEELRVKTIGPAFDEFENEAAETKEATIYMMVEHLEKRKVEEAEEAVRAAQRAEEERRLAALKAEQEAKMEADRRELAELRRKEAAREAEAKAAREEEARKTREAIEAERRVHEEYMAGERKKLEQERALAEATLAARREEFIANRTDTRGIAMELARATNGGLLVKALTNEVCKNIPEGFEITIHLERNAGWVTLTDDDGDTINIEFEADDDQISAEVMYALALAEANALVLEAA
jgi:colicin import membrane protein